ncbi:MAG: TatD family nuclease-associated radical SAM protein [Oscillospiraceae bacterium]|nr:TatD family nuclease-associated radical SAM protein [Oscillospiraceae bacterium]
MTISYEMGNSLYLNITNRCTNACDFCVRNMHDAVNGEDVLWLEREPDLEMISEDISKREIEKYEEIVACGYGEPMLRHDTLFEVFRWLKQKDASIKTRINTNGHGNLIANYDITPEMQGIVDSLSVSMNAKDAEHYDKICHSIYGFPAFDEMLEFAKKAKLHVPNVTLTVVDILNGEDIEECKKIAHGLGLSFRVRKMID